MGEQVYRFDRHEKRWKTVELAGPNPDRAPPISSSFKWHLARLEDRLQQQLRPHWDQKHGIWHIQVREGGDNWRTIFAAYDETTAHEGNQYPYMPLDMRVIDEFANSCLELKYDAATIEQARQLDENARADREAADEAREEQEQIEAIDALVTRGLTGVAGDHARARRKLEYMRSGPSDGTGFREFFPGADLKRSDR